MKRVILFLTIIEVLLLGLSSVRASHIEVCGDVAGVWSADTVIVICDVRVHPESTLSIEPGVLVLFDAYYSFSVDSGAVLRAIGTADRHITFTERSTGNGWNGIRFNGNYGSSRLEYCDLRHGLAQGSGDTANGGGVYLNASSPTILSCLFDSCHASKGGGVYCTNSSEPEIRDCSFLRNQASYGGAIYCNYSNPNVNNNIISANKASGSGIYCYSSSPTITNNTISNNSNGATIYCTSNSQPIIRGNSISYNSYSSSTHGIYCVSSSPVIDSNSVNNNSGSGIYCSNSSPEITGNQITANSQRGIYLSSSSPRILDNMIAMNNNSGIYCYSNAKAKITANIIKDNSSTYGGGISCYNSKPVITNNIIAGNTAISGGGIYLSNSNLDTLPQNTIVFNVAGSRGGAIFCNNSSPIIWNSILYFNLASQDPAIADSNGSAPNVTYCDVQGGRFGEGNIDVNPLFRDSLNGDYHLQDSINCSDSHYSPCIDQGNPRIGDTLLTCDWNLGAIRTDMGAYGGKSYIPLYSISGIVRDDSGMLLKDSLVFLVGDRRLCLHGEKTAIGTTDSSGEYEFTGLPTGNYKIFRDSLVWTYNIYLTSDTSGFNFKGYTEVNESPNQKSQSSRFALSQNYPNPFNAYTKIEFALKYPGFVSLGIYDILGRKVRTLVSQNLPSGYKTVLWDGKNNTGKDVASGIYFYRLKVENPASGEVVDFSEVKKLVLLK